MRSRTMAAALAALAASGCGKATGGAVDGTWKLTGVTCNGTTPSFNQTIVDSQYTFAITDTAATFSYLPAPGCRLTGPMTYTFSSGNRLSYAGNGNYTCAPASCSGLCGSAVTSAGYLYQYDFTGLDTMTWTSASDNTCSSNGVSDPIVYTFARQ
jgi:hypothetical protein